MNYPVKRVCAISDMSGIGRCALTVAIPVISTLGSQVCPLPTSCLSMHTGFTGIETIDLTDYIDRAVLSWISHGEKFDAIYSGYLGSPEQAGIILKLYEAQKDAVKLCDPVIGDNGKIYSGLSADTVDAMLEICGKADIITPNMTEYCLLTGDNYSNSEKSESEVFGMLEKLPSKAAVITSVPMSGGLVNAIRNDIGDMTIQKFNALPKHYPGTGDLFASVLCGCLLKGKPLTECVKLAAGFTGYAIQASMTVATDVNYGVQLEAVLPRLMEIV